MGNQPIDLNALIDPYLDSGLYLAVTQDSTSVAGTGKSIKEAMAAAAKNGCAEPVIMRAPSSKAMNNSLHL